MNASLLMFVYSSSSLFFHAMVFKLHHFPAVLSFVSSGHIVWWPPVNDVSGSSQYRRGCKINSLRVRLSSQMAAVVKGRIFVSPFHLSLSPRCIPCLSHSDGTLFMPLFETLTSPFKPTFYADDPHPAQFTIDRNHTRRRGGAHVETKRHKQFAIHAPQSCRVG